MHLVMYFENVSFLGRHMFRQHPREAAGCKLCERCPPTAVLDAPPLQRETWNLSRMEVKKPSTWNLHPNKRQAFRKYR